MQKHKTILLSVICCADIKNINDKIKTINAHLEIYRQWQNQDFINSSNKNKSDLNSKGLHLLECSAVSWTKFC